VPWVVPLDELHMEERGKGEREKAKGKSVNECLKKPKKLFLFCRLNLF
jgi:hypothetical protein